MNLNFAPSGLLSAMSIPITARGLGSLAVRAFSGKQAQHAAFIAFYRKCGNPDLTNHKISANPYIKKKKKDSKNYRSTILTLYFYISSL
jgi:hypothetical protein